MRLIRDHILREVHGNTVLVPLSGEETDFNGMIVLNQTAAFVCKLLQQNLSRAELIEALAREYEQTPEQVAEDVDAFLSELDACHMLIQ